MGPPPPAIPTTSWGSESTCGTTRHPTGHGATHTAQHHGRIPVHRAPRCPTVPFPRCTRAQLSFPLLSCQLLPQLPANLKAKGRWRRTPSCSLTAGEAAQGHAAIPFQQRTGSDFVSSGPAAVSTQRSRAALTHRAGCWVLQMEQSWVTDRTLQPLAGFQLFTPLESSGLLPSIASSQHSTHSAPKGSACQLQTPNTELKAEGKLESHGPGRSVSPGWKVECSLVLIGRKSVLIKMCCPPGGCVTHLGDVPLIWGTHHPSWGHITHLRGRIIHLGDILPP